MHTPRRVLVVTPAAERRGHISGALQDDFDVICCPGPTPPHYVCTGGRGERCPLVAAADLVVLDGWLASDDVGRGTSACELLGRYLDAGRPVATLIDPARRTEPLPSGNLVALRGDSTPRAVADAVRWLTGDDVGHRPTSVTGQGLTRRAR